MFSLDRCVSVRCLAFFLAIAYTSTIRAAELKYPLSIAIAPSGDVYLADRNLPGVWKLTDGKLILFFQGSVKIGTPLNAIRCVAVDSQGKLFAGDSSTRDVYAFDESGKPTPLTHEAAVARRTASTTAPSDKGADSSSKDAADSKKVDDKTEKPKTAEPPANKPPLVRRADFKYGLIGIPMDIAAGNDGSLFVSDLELHRIVKVPASGGEPQEFARVAAPRGICLDSENSLWVISNRRLVKISPSGEITTLVEDGIFKYPHTVAVAADKTAYVCDSYEKTIWKVPDGGKPEKLVSGEPLLNPVGMRLAGDTLWVVDPRAKSVFQISLDGKLTAIPLKAE